MNMIEWEMAGGPELDLLIAEPVMGLRLTPHPDVAKVGVARLHVRETGPVFTVQVGGKNVRVPMPPWEQLPQPRVSWNRKDRYFFYIAEQLTAEFAEEVAAYRLPAPGYSTHLVEAWTVVERLAAQDWAFQLQWNGAPGRYPNAAVATFVAWRGRIRDTAQAMGGTVPLAICRAALKTVGVTLGQRP